MIRVAIQETFPCQVATVWEIVTNNEDYQWRSDIAKITIEDSTHFTEYTKNGFPTYFTIIEKEECMRYAFAIKNKNMEGRWSGTFTEIATGCEVCFVEELQVHNWILRLFAKTFIKKQQRQYSQDIKQKIEELHRENTEE